MLPPLYTYCTSLDIYPVVYWQDPAVISSSCHFLSSIPIVLHNDDRNLHSINTVHELPPYLTSICYYYYCHCHWDDMITHFEFQNWIPMMINSIEIFMYLLAIGRASFKKYLSRSLLEYTIICLIFAVEAFAFLKYFGYWYHVMLDQ